VENGDPHSSVRLQNVIHGTLKEEVSLRIERQKLRSEFDVSRLGLDVEYEGTNARPEVGFQGEVWEREGIPLKDRES